MKPTIASLIASVFRWLVWLPAASGFAACGAEYGEGYEGNAISGDETEFGGVRSGLLENHPSPAETQTGTGSKVPESQGDAGTSLDENEGGTGVDDVGNGTGVDDVGNGTGTDEAGTGSGTPSSETGGGTGTDAEEEGTGEQ